MFLQNLFDPNARQLTKLKPLVAKINEFEPQMTALSDTQIKEKTQFWKDELSRLSSDKVNSYLDEILPEAYALVREVSRRVLKMRHYDVQLLAGIVLHQGKISEQKTGEGKTITAQLPLYLNSLTGDGVHLITPNDYLSRHGAGWMGRVYNALGVSVGVVVQERAFLFDPTAENAEFKDEYSKNLREVSRKEAYKADITYGTNHEFGFDYLRDNMVRSVDDIVQVNAKGVWGTHNFAIVDEVDNILIDIARTPLIISVSDPTPTKRYIQADSIIKQLLKNTDYEVDEKFHHVTLTDFGIRRVEKILGISNLYEQDFEMVHLLEQALSANTLYEKDRDYVVKDGKVLIVDQFTGRILPNNRYSHGLHQAIEAKEQVQIQQESKTRAEISYQNYFRLYKKLAGMTGTAATEAEEFYKIYKLDVVVIPANRPNIRLDANDVVYKTVSGKFRAIAEEIAERHAHGQPVLVGTTSVEKSEMLHELLKRRNIPHQILNAKNHEQEALIIAQAGRKGAVTISTNMAGRGVDIILGGDPPFEAEQAVVRDLGGLHVIGTERHESRRIDNQLRGRAGRQGDPGSSRFYVSLQDDLMRIFGGAQVESLMNRFGIDDSVPLEAGLVSRVIESAQKRVEGFHFDARKSLVDRDDVVNVHRDVIYKLRTRVLEVGHKDLTVAVPQADWLFTKLKDFCPEDVVFDQVLADLEKNLGKAQFYFGISQLSLEVIDLLWMEHLVDMANLQEGIGLRGYAQKDPIVEFKKEGHSRFDNLVATMYQTVVDRLLRVRDINIAHLHQAHGTMQKPLNYVHGEFESGISASDDKSAPVMVDEFGRSLKIAKVADSAISKIGRNDPCHCGSGKKYKNCHGKA